MKPSSEFHKHSSMLDGLQKECKQCKADRYVENIEKTRTTQAAYWAEYASKNRDMLREKGRVYRLGTKQRGTEYRSAYKIEFAPKIAAKSTVWSHILTNRLVKQPCEVCGEGVADAHHDDYSKPLEVRWLCRAHHGQWHAKHGEGKNGRAIEKAVRGEKP